MKIRIKGYKINNIRRYEELSVDIEENGTTLIMMPNGTGKTTTINLLRAVLSNHEFSKNDVMSYSPDSGENTEGNFLLNLLVDDMSYAIDLRFDYISGEYRYYYTDTIKGMSEVRPKVFELFSKDFVEKFIFDGELAKEFLNSKSAYAEESIKNLYHIDKFDDLTNRIETIKDLLISETTDTTASEERGYKLYINKKKKLEKYEKALLERQDDLLSKEKELKEEIKTCEFDLNQIYSSNDKINDSINEHRNNKNKMKGELNNYIKILGKESLFVHNINEMLWNSNRGFAETLVNMKLPKNVSEQFFLDIINDAETCICGRKLTENERNFINNNYDKYLEDNNISILNELKNQALRVKFSDRLGELDVEMRVLDDEIASLSTKIERAEEKASKGKKKEFDELKKKKQVADSKLSRVKNELDRIQANDESEYKDLNEKNNLKKVQKEISKVDNIINQVKMNRNINLNSKELKEVLNKSKEIALKEVKKDILTCTNNKINKIITNDRIHVESVENYIKIKDRTGVSMGQSLSVAYSFISSVFDDSYYDLPFVIDSPAGSLDNSYRAEVAKIIPKAFRQLVMFVISSEKSYFTEVMEKVSDNSIKYYTIHKSSSNLIQEEGFKYFKEFQMESENV